MISEPLGNFRFQLAEGPFWDSKSGNLWWVDIIGNKVCHINPREIGTFREFSFVEPSAVIDVTLDSVVICAGSHVYWLERNFGTVQKSIQLPEIGSNNRTNEAKMDSFGNMWIGTMNRDQCSRTGNIWRIDPAGNVHHMLDHMGIPNTFAWDETRNRMYFGDSLDGNIYVSSIDSESTSTLDKTIFFHYSQAPGVPDGSAIDDQGRLFNARWGGSMIAVINHDGVLETTIDVPVEFPTSCIFSPMNCHELFVTTAKHSSKHVLSGAVLRFFRANFGR